MAETEIGILEYPGAQTAAVLGMADLLVVADRLAREGQGAPAPLLRVSHWSCEDGPPRRTGGTGREGEPTALLLPPALGEPVSAATAAPFVDHLRERHRAGVVLGSVCAGAFLLAETGLLAGRPATTHWAHADQLHRRHPDILIDTDRLLIDNGDIITAGGVMAWTDLCLRLIERFLGTAVMLATARSFLIDPPGREQRYYSGFAPRLDHGDAAVLNVQHWLRETGARDTRLARLAEQAGLEEWTLLRRFRKATGLTSTEYGQRLRVARAQELLGATSDAIDRIAWTVGYGDPAAFRKVFTRITGLTPGAYRRRFRAG